MATEISLMKSPNGTLTFAYVDLERWCWAIVKDFEGCQDFGEVLMAFDEEHLPSPERIATILAALEN